MVWSLSPSQPAVGQSSAWEFKLTHIADIKAALRPAIVIVSVLDAISQLRDSLNSIIDHMRNYTSLAPTLSITT